MKFEWTYVVSLISDIIKWTFHGLLHQNCVHVRYNICNLSYPFISPQVHKKDSTQSDKKEDISFSNDEKWTDEILYRDICIFFFLQDVSIESLFDMVKRSNYQHTLFSFLKPTPKEMFFNIFCAYSFFFSLVSYECMLLPKRYVGIRWWMLNARFCQETIY